MDEPFSNVDPEMRTQLRQMLRDIHKTYDATIIFVTHDLSEAFSLADRIAVLTDGKVEEVGTPRQLRTAAKSELLRRYLQL
jgi:ABC-type proline/glycine betaine transport system ATPase subunit